MIVQALLTLLLAHEISSFVPRQNNHWIPLPNSKRKLQGTGLSDVKVEQDDQVCRSIVSIDPHPAIPVWPSWGGGKVIPVSLGSELQDPFLLLAHHDHWFAPWDPLRKPFMAFGKALGLPYVDVEGFPMHPHRGFDIFTYILDGCDGFRHSDTLGKTSKLYRGGTCQWMRTGSGVMHEEFWETDSEKRTNIELFQIWVNLPSLRKFDEPVIEYIGASTSHPWIESDITDSKNVVVGSVRDISGTLDKATTSTEAQERSAVTVKPRPPLKILHTKLQPGKQWDCLIPSTQSTVVYVRRGKASICTQNQGEEPVVVKQRNTATFGRDGDLISIQNKESTVLDMLILAAAPLREPVASAGPIVMNTADEVDDAYRQLQDGTFLKRDHVLRQQMAKGYWRGE